MAGKLVTYNKEDDKKKKQTSPVMVRRDAPSVKTIDTEKKTIKTEGSSQGKTQGRLVTYQAKKSSSNWYKGSTPTRAETAAQVYRRGMEDPSSQEELNRLYQAEISNPNSPIYERYAQPTSDYMQALGLSEVNDDIVNNYLTPLLSGGVYTSTGALSTAKRNGAEALLASDAGKLIGEYNDTNALLAEQDQINRRMQYLVGKGWTDDEIKADISARMEHGEYSKLSSALKKGSEGGIVRTTAPIAMLTSYGMDGMLWGIRNPNEATGDYELDAVQKELGWGTTYTDTEENIARRTRGSASWAPYANGTTMDDEAILFGVSQFDQKWLDENRQRILASGDQDMIDAFSRVWDAEQKTRLYEEQAAAFKEEVMAKIEAGASPEEIFADGFLDSDGFEDLKDLYEGYLKGNPASVTRSVDFDIAGLRKFAQDEWNKKNGLYTTDEYEQQLSDAAGGTHITDPAKQEMEDFGKLNYDIILPQYAPIATLGERMAFRISASAGFNDVVGKTADVIANGTGGSAEMVNSMKHAAVDYAKSDLFDAWNTIDAAGSLESFYAEGVADAVTRMFPDLEEGKMPTQEDFDRMMAERFSPEKYTEYFMEHGDGMGFEAERNAAMQEWNFISQNIADAQESYDDQQNRVAEAQQKVEDVKASLAEAFGEDTDDYRAVVATLEAAHQYAGGVPKTWSAYDTYQQYGQMEGVTPETMETAFVNMRGRNARDIRYLQAQVDNFKVIGMPKNVIDNAQRQLDDLKKQNELLNAHNLQNNENYQSSVDAFDKTFGKAAYDTQSFLSAEGYAGYVMLSVNNPEAAFAAAGVMEGQGASYGDIVNFVKDASSLAGVMTDEERSNYKYLYMTKGAEAATEYFDTLSENLTVRLAQEQTQAVEDLASENALGAVTMTAVSTLLTPVEAINGVEMALRMLAGEELNPYGEMFFASRVKGASRQGTKELITEAVGDNKVAASILNTLYDAVTSGADSAISGVVGGGGWTSSAIMGLSSFQNATMDASMRGATKEQAILYGVASAFVETITEKSQIDEMLSAFSAGASGVKGFFDKTLKGFVSEFGEETLSSIGGLIADELIMKAMSNRERAIEEYMALGLSKEEAETQAAKDVLTDALYSGFVGGISGGMTSAAGYTAGAILGTNTTPTEQPEQPGTPQERAVATLATANQSGVGEQQKAGTISGVMQSFGVMAEEANATAKSIVEKGWGMLVQRMTPAAQDGPKLMNAISMAANSASSQCAQVMQEAATYASERVEKLLEAYDRDVQDANVMAEYDASVTQSMEADATAQILATMPPVDKSKVEAANQAVADAQENLRTAQAEMAAVTESITQSNEKLRQNPADQQAAQKMRSDMQKRAQMRKTIATQGREIAQLKNAAKKAGVEYKSAIEQQMNDARAQAKEAVAQRRAEMEEATVQAQEQQKAEQETANVREMEFQNYLEEKTPNATPEQVEQLRADFNAVYDEMNSEPVEEGAQPEPEDEQTKKNKQFASTIGKRFGVNVEFRDTKGVFKGAYYRGRNTIILDQKLSQGEAIFEVALHELTHRAEGGGLAYNAYANSILDIAFNGDKKKIRAEIKARQERYNNRFAQLAMSGREDINANGLKPLSKADARKELVADLTRKVLYGDEQMINQLVESDPQSAYTFLDWVKDTIKRLTGVRGEEIDRLNRTRDLFEKALGKAEERIQQQAENSNHPSSVQFSIEQFARGMGFTFEKIIGGDKPYRILDEDGNVVEKVTAEMVKPTPMGMLIDTAENNGTVDADTSEKQRGLVADVMNLITEFRDQAMVWELVGSELFSAIKSNSDKQYGTTVDFGTICSKTREVVNVMSEAMLQKGRGLTRDEVLTAYRETHNVGLSVPCPVCYVFSRWMGVPSLLETMRKGQERFGNASAEEVNTYLKSVEEKYAKDNKKLSQVMSGVKSSLQKKLEEIDMALRKGELSPSETDDKIKQSRELQKELDDVELYNWVRQVLAKTDKSGKNPILDKDGNVVLDPNYKPVPNEVLLDLRRTGEFASEYAKSWKFRTTRGAGMGKAILPYSGAELGDSVSGTKRWSAKQNPFFMGDAKSASTKLKNAITRAKAQNLIGGQRFQSTSDYRPEWGLDYLMTFLEMQAIGAKGQLYTKVIEAVDMFASAGVEVNLSIMPKGDGYHMENGKPVLGDDDFSSVTGIDFKGAYEKTKLYDNVQMILVGINDDHIRAAMADDRISFVIPWHSSGNSQKTLDEMIRSVGETTGKKQDYTDSQSDKVGNQTEEQKAAWQLRQDILTGKFRKKGKKEAHALTDPQREILANNPYLADLYNKFYVDESSEAYGVSLSASQASQIFPHEYWDTNLTVDQADENGRRFVEYCESMGIQPRFSQFKDDPGYWKLLIDRRMYARDGSYHHPQQIDVTNVEIGQVASKVSQAKVGTKEQISEATQRTLDEIDARLSDRAYDMTVDNESPYEEPLDLSGGQFSLDEETDTSDDSEVRKEEIRAWKNERNSSNERLRWGPGNFAVNQNPLQKQEASAQSAETPDGKKERQFVSQYMYDAEVIPDYVRDALKGDDETRMYDVDTNKDQVKRGIRKIRQNGMEAELNRLLSLDQYSADDMAESAVMIAMASHENNAEVLMALSAHEAVARTGAGKALQAANILKKMTPTGMQAFVTRDVQRRMMEELDKRSEKAKALEASAKNIEKQVAKASSEATSDDNKWGVSLTERQTALIKLYGLTKEARPGLHYNRATLKQRMLEAIIATPDPTAVVGGLSLIQRLEYMQAGIPVATVADINYIKMQMSTFAINGGVDGGRDSDMAVSRAYEAYGNITPVTRMEKIRTQRYVNMLSSLASFLRNIIGNAGQNVINAGAHGVGVLVDKAVSGTTHRRTTTTLNLEERRAGWAAFKEETVNTFRDFFIDKTNTAPNRDKYDMDQHGRTFQTAVLEGAKDVESFLMSVGDRNIWKKNFVNSMAEQQKLAAEGLLFNDDGSEVTQEQMIKRAEADANYSTFTEDNVLRGWMSDLRRRSPVAADIVGLFVPFTGVPSNVFMRNFQYSPVGFVTAGIRYAANKQAGKAFDQHAFVNDVSRAFTGSMAMVAGGILGAMGFIRMGSEEEDKQRAYDVATAMGEQYTPYVYDPFTGTYVSLSTFSPAASPLVWGAAIADALKDDENKLDAFIAASCGSVNSIFGASFLSGITDIFKDGLSAENIVQSAATNVASSLTPAWLNQLANSLDPYVRDTKDKSFIMGLVKSTMNRVPGLRELLPEKITVTGETVETKGWWSMIDPLTRTTPNNNPVLIESKRLYDATGDTAVLPNDALRGKKNSFTYSTKIRGKEQSVTVTLDDHAKEAFKKRYGELWTSDMERLLNLDAYNRLDDDDRADRVERIMKNALEQVKKEFYEMYGDDPDKE